MTNSRLSIIAEVGSNYDGSLEAAQEYVVAAKRMGADAVKFQTLLRDRLVAPRIWSDKTPTDNPVYQGFKNLELPAAWHYVLKRKADENGIEFISTPFHLEAVDLLEDVGVRTYKVASGDM